MHNEKKQILLFLQIIRDRMSPIKLCMSSLHSEQSLGVPRGQGTCKDTLGIQVRGVPSGKSNAKFRVMLPFTMEFPSYL